LDIGGMIGIYLTNNSQALAPNWCSSWRPRHEGRKGMAAADSVAQTLVRSSDSIRMAIKERNLLPDTLANYINTCIGGHFDQSAM